MIKRIIVLGDSEDSIDVMLKDREGITVNPIQTLVNRIPIPTYLLGVDGEKSQDQVSLSLKKIKRDTCDRVDKEMISYALRKTQWNRAMAAKMLNISYKLLCNKIDELGIGDGPHCLDSVSLELSSKPAY